MTIVTVTDTHVNWIKQSFMLPGNTITQVDRYYRELTTASYKFTDTRLGGNFCINNVPQYTHYADLRSKGRLSSNQQSSFHIPRGMGRYYSESIDDNSQLIHMQFGVPSFNGMVSFFTGFYNNDAATLARTGTNNGLFYTLGRVAGFIASLYAWPILAAGVFIRFFSTTPSSKYYYLKPAMVAYWNRVNTVVNSLAVNMGLVSRAFEFNESVNPEGEAKGTTQITDADRQMFYKLAPDIFHPSGAIDIYAVANRAQRLANKSFEKLKAIGENTALSSDQLIDQYAKFATETLTPVQGRPLNPETNGKGKGDSYVEQYHSSFLGKPVGSSTDVASAAAGWRPTWKAKEGTSGDKTVWQKVVDFGGSVKEAVADSSLAQNFLADMRDGSMFATFRVDFTGTVEESFSNSTKESEISNTINGMSSAAANARFSFSDGNTGIGVVDSVVGAARDVASGALESLNISGIMSLAGAAFVDFPKHWESSSASFPRSTYTIQLRSPYGNPMARYTNLYVPLAMLLAGALPLSTGKRSYTSPFILQLFSKGRNTIRLGMIDSLTVTRGVGNMGWTADGHPLGIDISLSIVDLSTVMHMPIAPYSSFLNPLDGVTDDDNAWTDYMAVLGSLTLAEQYYTSRKLAINLTRRWTQFRSNFSTAKITNTLFNSTVGQFLNAFAQVGERTVGR